MSTRTEAIGSWRLAVRLARRTAWRSRTRTVLIVLMLALPVYPGTVLALAYAATYPSADAEASWRLGQADYSLDGPGLEQVLATLPAGTQTAWITDGRTPMQVAGGYGLRDYVAVDVGAPLTRGMFQLRRGRAPRGPGEVAVSAALAGTDRIRLGDRVLVGLPPTARTVVGVVDAAWELSLPLVVSPAGQRLSPDAPHALVKLPAGAAWTPATGGSGLSWMYRADAQPGAVELATRKAALVLVVGFAGTQVALLSGAAFAIGAARQRRELAILAAVGAGRAQRVRLVLAQGLLLGAVAGACGVGLGALTYWLNRGRVERIANHPLNPGNVPVWWLAGIALFAVAVGLLAALVPARGAARRPRRDGLAGREPTSRSGSVRWLAGGALVAGAGAAVAARAASSGNTVALAAGTVAILLGVAALAPALVTGAGRFAARLPLPLRLAARHAARHRLRTAASIAAVCAAVAGSMALMFYGAADTAAQTWSRQPTARPGQVVIPAAAARLTPAQVGAVEAALPVRASLTVTTLTQPAGLFDGPQSAGPAVTPPQSVAVGGTEAELTGLIRAVTGTEPPPAVLATLHAGGAVTFYPDLLRDGYLHVGDDLAVPAVLLPVPDSYTDLPGAVISTDTATRHHLPTRMGGILVDTTRAPTAAELATANARALAAQLHAAPSALPAELVVGAKPARHGRDYSPMFLILAAVGGVVTLAASAVAVGLATSEMRNDLSTLAAAGAGPRLRRRIAGAQAGLIVGIGVLLGLPGGIAPAAGLVAFRSDLDWRVPWLPLALTVVVVPALAITGTALLTRPRLELLRRLN